MKKILLIATLAVAGLSSAKGTLIQNSQIDNSITKEAIVFDILLKKNRYVFVTSCGNFITETDKTYSDSELIAAFVGIEAQYCNTTVDFKDVIVTP